MGSPPNAVDLQILEDIWHGEAVDYLTLQILVARCMAKSMVRMEIY